MTLEFLLVFPALAILTLGFLEFSILFLVAQTLQTAAIEGAREKAKGASDVEVIADIDEFLAVLNIATADRRVIIKDGLAVATDTGPASITCAPSGETPDATEVRVTVCVNVSDGGEPVPNLLAVFDLTLANRVFQFSALAEKE